MTVPCPRPRRQSLARILTALATLVTALAGLVTALGETGWIARATQ